MSKVGKWGITRDETGELAILTEWPWYWRYASGALILSLTGWLLYSIMDSGRPDWQFVAVGGGGLLIALAVMYELGCLAVVVAVGAVIWNLAAAFLPGFGIGLKTVVFFVALLAAYGVLVANEARRIAIGNARAIENIWQRLNRLDH